MKILQLIALFFLSCISVFAASGDVEPTQTTEVIPANSYVYYYGQWCAYCAQVDKYFTAVDAMSKIDLEKREVYFDDDNRSAMIADATALGLDPNTIGVPFLVINSWSGTETSYLVWDAPIIEHFTPLLGEVPESHKKTIVLIILGLIVVGVIGGLVFWNKK